MIEDETERPRLTAADSPAPALDAQAIRTDVPVLDRYGLREGQVCWRCWPALTGAPDAPVVVLLHGGSGSWTHWLRTIPALRQRFTLLVPDIPGYGDSGRVPGGTPVAGLAERLAHSLDTLGQVGRGPLVVVGFSFGGVVAGSFVEQLVQRDPQRVRRLVLVGAVGLGIVRRSMMNMESWRWIEDLDELRGVHRRNLLALMLKHPESVDDLALALQDANVRRTRYVSKREAHGSGLADVLTDLEVPVHGIWGDADPTADGRVDEVPQMLADLSPGTTTDIVPDCGHWVMWERPEAFNALLMQAIDAKA